MVFWLGFFFYRELSCFVGIYDGIIKSIIIRINPDTTRKWQFDPTLHLRFTVIESGNLSTYETKNVLQTPRPNGLKSFSFSQSGLDALARFFFKLTAASFPRKLFREVEINQYWFTLVRHIADYTVRCVVKFWTVNSAFKGKYFHSLLESLLIT